ncbi:hypothetical protein, partial [Leyella stercorea]|uniref:hypothetical protein n=1 Tax=Leyella stercorea TaxID=363265 RepID=UPI00242A56B3
LVAQQAFHRPVKSYIVFSVHSLFFYFLILRCKDTLFFRNFQEINKKSFVSGGGEGEKQKSATPGVGIALLYD